MPDFIACVLSRDRPLLQKLFGELIRAMRAKLQEWHENCILGDLILQFYKSQDAQPPLTPRQRLDYRACSVGILQKKCRTTGKKALAYRAKGGQNTDTAFLALRLRVVLDLLNKHNGIVCLARLFPAKTLGGRFGCFIFFLLGESEAPGRGVAWFLLKIPWGWGSCRRGGGRRGARRVFAGNLGGGGGLNIFFGAEIPTKTCLNTRRKIIKHVHLFWSMLFSELQTQDRICTAPFE